MIVDNSRLFRDAMEWYRANYAHVPKWDGIGPLKDKRVIVYCEQGFGDCIHMARYFHTLQQQGCHVTLHCPQELETLLAQHVPGVDRTIAKHQHINPQEFDCHLPSFDLPFVLPVSPNGQCINFRETHPDIAGDKPRLGIAWEGSPHHPNNHKRCCPLKYFLPLQQSWSLYMLQPSVQDTDLLDGAEDMELLGVELNDFRDTARLINSMDAVISVDTAVLHLAGALGKRAIGLLAHDCDPRWLAGQTWYESVFLLRQKEEYDWDGVFTELSQVIR